MKGQEGSSQAHAMNASAVELNKIGQVQKAQQTRMIS